MPASPILARLALLPLLGVLAGCAGAASADSGPLGPARELRLGLFANVTHATPLVGLAQGFYARELGTTRLRYQVFNAGPAAVEAIFAGAVDAAYTGPNPAVNAYVRSHGEAVRIIAGAASGGASLVVRPGIDRPEQLRGARIATPQLGGTQDVALRAWLAEHGLRTTITGGGDVRIYPTANATTLRLFQQGRIDAAWVPEPWASRLELEAGAKVLVDERDLWPDRRFVTTNLIVSTRFLRQHPQTVDALLRGHVAATAWIRQHPEQAKRVVNAQLGALGGKPLAPAVLDRAWSRIEVTDDPLAVTLAVSARHAYAAGLLSQADLRGIYELRPLNAVLRARGQPPVDDAGLGDRTRRPAPIPSHPAGRSA
ncbi:ABC transporter [Carbonactinospora thermoautotrophica]|uniref:ABC transporter n=1 Tax=Carbonactinospora thermoautotrophica TaxID=1469144 RepID=A0A132MQ78_9ACTN|nr:ABC transporter substrate-binding protein [Carbonactinospora thermoautotrophica]KWW99992.1 ABC transporter [Carbonactinospora thermoautotrophica]